LTYIICSFTRFHPSILELSDSLHTVLLSLPVKGNLYTAIYPVWPIFIAAVTANSDKRDRLYQRVVPIREGDKNTLPAVLKRISGLRIWLASQDASCHRRENWWDEMLSPSSSTIALGNVLYFLKCKTVSMCQPTHPGRALRAWTLMAATMSTDVALEPP
jgi:hypothetical protein